MWSSTTVSTPPLAAHLSRSARTQSNLGPASVFGIRSLSTTRGLAMFATTQISSGDIIVSEPPIVSHRNDNEHFNLCCHSCHNPIGDLRQQIETALATSSTASTTFPFIGRCRGPVFTEKATPSKACPYQCGTTWCNATCYKQSHQAHILLCPQFTQENQIYANHASSSTECEGFHLVGAVLAQLVVVWLKLSPKEMAEKAHLYKYCWWREYSHPVWWDLQVPRAAPTAASTAAHTCTNHQESRKELCKVSHQLLHKALGASLTKLGTSTTLNVSTASTAVQWVDELFTLENVGEIMGMLTCNAMEIEFASPLQEYFDMVLEQQSEPPHEEPLEQPQQQHAGEGGEGGGGEAGLLESQSQPRLAPVRLDPLEI